MNLLILLTIFNTLLPGKVFLHFLATVYKKLSYFIAQNLEPPVSTAYFGEAEHKQKLISTGDEKLDQM